jgi:hypothetical protein
MDIRCRHCGEPVDLSELGQYADAFAINGCTALDVMYDGGSVTEAKRAEPCSEPHYDGDVAAMDEALYDLLGGDYDGIASSMGDL